MHFLINDVRIKIEPYVPVPIMQEIRDRVAEFQKNAGMDGNAKTLEEEATAALSEGDAFVKAGDLVAASGKYAELQRIAGRLVDLDATSAKWQRCLSVAYSKIGEVRQDQNDPAGALEALQNAQKVIEPMAQRDPLSAEWQRDLSRIWSL